MLTVYTEWKRDERVARPRSNRKSESDRALLIVIAARLIERIHKPLQPVQRLLHGTKRLSLDLQKNFRCDSTLARSCAA